MTAALHGDPGSCSQVGGSLRRLATELRSAARRTAHEHEQVAHEWSGRVARDLGRRTGAVVDAVQLVRLPYHLSALTQAAARAAIAQRDALLATVEAIKEQRDRIVGTLRERGIKVADSDANFVLFEVGGDQKIAWQRLLDQGVLVRDVGLPGWLRVTAGTPAETDAFLEAVR